MSTDRSPDRDRPDEDVDAEFARIIAGWDDSPDSLDPSGHGTSSVVDSTSPTVPGTTAGASTPPPRPTPPMPGPRDFMPDDEPEDRYLPPDPPPLPRGDPALVVSWAAVLLGPLFLLFAGLFWRNASPVWLGLAVASFVGGFIALVLRMPAHRHDDSDDDGAVV